MRVLNQLLALSVLLGLGALAIEGTLRAIGMGPPVTLNQFDPVTGWSKVPGLSVRRKGAEYDVQFTFNEHGLREPTDRGPETKGERLRLLCVGDSFVLGFSVEQRETLSAQLEALLRERGWDAEVLNVGVEGWSTDQEVAWLAANAGTWQADGVLLLPYENDLYWNTQDHYLRFPKPRYDASGKPLEAELRDPGPRALRDRSALARRLLAPTLSAPTFETDGHVLLREHAVLLKDGGPDAEAVARHTRGALIALADLGLPTLVCPIPSHAAVDATYATEVFGPRVLDELSRERWDPNLPVKQFLEWSAGAGLATHDPRPALTAGSGDQGPFYFDVDWHLTPSGYRALAESLIGPLVTAGLLPTETGAPMSASDPNGAPARTPLPRWPLVYALLVAVLGTLYQRTWRDESAIQAYGKIALFLAVVFTLALGGGALLGGLSPEASGLARTAIVVLLLGFLAWKLGDRLLTVGELLAAFVREGHWYLMPLVVALVTIGSLLVVAASSPLAAPFIYTLF